MNFREILEHVHAKELEELKEQPYHYHVFALDKKAKRLILLDSTEEEEEVEEILKYLPKHVPTFSLRVYGRNPNVARNQGMLVLWLVDNDIIGAECSKILRDLEQASANQTLRPQPNWQPR